MSKNRRNFTPQQKADIVRRHLKDKVPVSSLAEELSIQPTQIYQTSPYYPQSNGKLERWHGSIKQECIRPSCPATKEEAEKRVDRYVLHYNTIRLHSAIGYVTPADCLADLSEVIGEERDRKLEEARERRQAKRLREKQVA